LAVITCIEDLRRLARRRVPRMFYEYVDCGSWTGSTYRANERDVAAICFRQRVAVNVENRSLRTAMIGEEVTIPVALAPIGLCGMQWPAGEIHAARAAEKFGVPFCLSTMSICSIEELTAATAKPFWFQLYVMRDRGFVERLIARAKEAKCPALIATLDLPFMGQRHNDIRNGLAVPPRLTIPNLVDLARRPRWCLGMLRARRWRFGNFAGHVKGVSDAISLLAWIAGQFDPSVTWDDIAWIRRLWPGKLVLKGIMDAEDAKRAIETGADAIVVSNHGGRQLDGAPSSIYALPRIAQAVGSRTEIWFDGGIRSGQDILKALALGAKGTMIGRAFVYGLGAMGETGVRLCLDILANELSATMALCGVTKISQVDSSVLVTPPRVQILSPDEVLPRREAGHTIAR